MKAVHNSDHRAILTQADGVFQGLLGSMIFRRAIKRAFDVILAISLLVLLAPLLLIMSALLLLLHGRPLTYASERYIGKSKIARIFKFRTMVPDAASPKYRLKDKYLKNGYMNIPLSDEVYTPPGRWLERLQIVELLQIINVLKDGMSFVGNRPLPPDNIQQLRRYDGWEQRFDSPSGITGITQVIGKCSLPASERLRMEIMYSKLYSSPNGNVILCDIMIILCTIRFVLAGISLTIDQAEKMIRFANSGRDL